MQIIAFVLGLALLSASISASQSGATSWLTVHKTRPGVTSDFNTDAIFNYTVNLSNASAFGTSAILTPGIDPSDINGSVLLNGAPSPILVCPGNFTLRALSDGVWLNQSFASQSPYPGDPCLCPAMDANGVCLSTNPWALTRLNSILWNFGPVVCGSSQPSLMHCIQNIASGYISRANTLWPLIPTNNVQVNTDYTVIGGQKYPNTWARGALLCNGFFNVTVQNSAGGQSGGQVRSQPYGEYTFELMPGTYTISNYLRVLDCYGVVNKWEERPAESDSCANKYFTLTNAAGHALPAVTGSSSFNLSVADPQNCSAEYVSVNPDKLEDLGPLPIPNNQDYELQITVRNPHADVYIQANDVYVDPSSTYLWTAAPSTITPNGFGQPIAPMSNQVLYVRITTPPTGPVSGPVPLVIVFNSSTPLCSGANCTSNLTIPVLNGTHDLVSIAIATPPEADVGETVEVEAITWNNGTTPTPLETNSTVDLDGNGIEIFSVYETLAPTSWPGPDGVRPDQPYVSQLYPYVCEYPHIASIIVRSDYDNHLPENNEANNVAVAVINCGNVLGCYDYM